MNLVLNPGERRRARMLVKATSKNGADATRDMLRHFRPEVIPALVAYLAAFAAEATEPTQREVWTRGKPDALTEAQRREAHRRFNTGDRTPEVVAGNREYHRNRSRECRARKKGAA